MRYLLRTALFLLVSVTLAAAQDRPRIVTVNYALQYFAERLVGEAAEVVFPVPEGVDPSFWRPAISDISMIQSADLVLLNGANFASWVDRVSLRRSKVVNTSVGFVDRYIATQSLTHSHGDGGEHSHEGVASYTWLDPALAKLQAEAIAAAVIARGIAPEAEVTARLADLSADLDALDAAMRAATAELHGTPLIATHPRYQYFARAYGLTVQSLDWEAGAAPDADQLARLEALVTANNAKVLIWEAAPPAEALEAVASLDLQSLIFPPLARKPMSGDFLDQFGPAVSQP